MNLNLPLLLLSALSAAALAVRSVAVRPRAADWLVISLVVLVAAGVAYAAAPTLAGYVAFTVWAATTLLPMLLSVVQARALARQRYGLALAAARALALAHPSRAYRRQLVRVRAVHALSTGDVEAAIRDLERYGDAPPRRAEAEIEIARIRGDHGALRRLLHDLDVRREPSPPPLTLARMRALAELGERSELFATFRRFERTFEGAAAAPFRTAAQLLLLAEGGRVGDVEGLLRGRLASSSPAIRRLWLAIARRAAGDPGAERDLREAASSSDALLRRAAALRLAGAPPSEPLAPADAELLDHLSARLTEEDVYHLGSRAATRPWVTHGIGIVTAATFAIEELFGGSTDPRVLDAMGALVPELVLRGGEWWRIVTPMFLHYGFVHLAFNLLGLYVLGPFVERALGRERYLFVYLASGTAVGALVVLASRLFALPEARLVGASGAIMGIVGATAAILVRGAFRERVKLARQRLALLAIVMAFQVVFDFVVPNVSFLAHASGAAAGFVLGALLSKRRP